MIDPIQYQAPAGLLAERTIVVTGAGSGIGEAAAKSYAAHGAAVILMGRTVAKLEQVYDDIVAAGHPQPAIVPIDFSGAVAGDYEQIGQTVLENFPVIDGLLHNASILGERRALEQQNPASWHEVMQVNVNAQFMLTQALLPGLRESDDASIIFTSSSVGRKGRAYWGVYSVSKFATEGMMQVWADELGSTSNIRVNSLNPGGTNTAMRRSAYPAEQPDNNPSPEQIMNAYLFLMGPDSRDVNGEAINAQHK